MIRSTARAAAGGNSKSAIYEAVTGWALGALVVEQADCFDAQVVETSFALWWQKSMQATVSIAVQPPSSSHQRTQRQGRHQASLHRRKWQAAEQNCFHNKGY